METKEYRVIREIAFDTYRGFIDGKSVFKEKIRFLGPPLLDGQDSYNEATEAELLEFIAYWTNQIGVATDYLLNGHNPNTTEWTRRAPAPRSTDGK